MADTQTGRLWGVNVPTGAVVQYASQVVPSTLDQLRSQDTFLISDEAGQPGWIFLRRGGEGSTVFVPAVAVSATAPARREVLTSAGSSVEKSLATAPLPGPTFALTVNQQPATITDQPSVTLTLSQPFSSPLTAVVTLSFTPNAAGLPSTGYVPGGSYPGAALQFASGGTSATVNIPANSTTATIPGIQIGDVAGTITVTLASATEPSGQTIVLPSPPPSTTITVPPLAPIITPGSVQIINLTGSGFTVDLVASSTSRDLTSATFGFTPAAGAQLNGATATLQLGAVATSWFGSAAGQTAGGAFDLQVPFPFSGDTSAIGSVSVALTNSVGTSVPVSGGVNVNGVGGGLCPTFIQVRSLARPERQVRSANGLFARIAVPVEGALLRSDIPIYGEAGGAAFRDYRVEYGEGANPTKWTVIQSSGSPQPVNKIGITDIQSMQGDMDLRGNLATWNTGLKEWVHLPWHPAEDPTDLRGEYTLRLVVTGKDGKAVEDRVNVEVGRVISQVLPGDAISTDNKVRMHFEPQSLPAPFRVYTIKPLTADVPTIPAGLELVGSAYTIREPGDRFLKPVTLQFDISQSAPSRDPSQLGIYVYDAGSHQWEPLPTFRADDAGVLETSIYSLPDLVADYAVFYGSGNRILPRVQPGGPTRESAAIEDGAVVVFDTFETSTGEWAARDRDFGAAIARDRASTKDGTYSLKITNKNAGGDFAVTAVSTPFRSDTYPIVSFDYRVEAGVKTDFYVRIGTRWYCVRFTGDEAPFRNSDVGITAIGQVEGVIADGQWHSTSFDLNQMLATKTARREVDEIIMANWRVAGYMKLDFGDNPRGASYYIDNFKIRRGENTFAGRENRPKELLVDDFDGPASFNRLGGSYDVFSDPGTLNVAMSRVAYPPAAGAVQNQALLLKYDVTREGAYGGYWSQLRGAPGDEFDQLAMKVKSSAAPHGFLIGLKRKDGTEVKVSAERYWGPVGADGWREIAIPLIAFGSPKELAALDVFSISFASALGHGKGDLWIDDIRLARGLTSVLVADFDDDINTNRLMQKNWIFSRGAASVAATAQRADSGHGSQSLRLSYGGTIGLDLGSGDFSYAGWVAGLGGIDGSGVTRLQLRVRGQTGGEHFNVYLDDGTTRKSVDSSNYFTISRDWKEVSIPIEVFGKQGVDLTHLQELQMVFEWKAMSGTVYLDDIRLTQSGTHGK